MADLTRTQSDLPINIAGVNPSTGVGTFFANVDTNGNLFVLPTTAGSVNAGIAATNSNLVGGIYNSTLPTLTTGQQVSLQLNSSGYLLVAPPLLVTPVTQNITIQDTASTTTVVANGQNFITGTPTTGSAASFVLSNEYTVIVQVTGTWTGTLQVEVSMDGGTTWSQNTVTQDGTNYTLNAFSNNFTGRANTVGYTNYRLRATTAITGTAVVRITEAVGPSTVYINNAIKLTDNAGDIAIISSTGSLHVLSNSAGPVTPGTVATNSDLIGGQYNSTLPTLTNTEQSAVQLDSSGRILVSQPTASALNAQVVGNVASGTVDSGNGVKIASVANVNIASLPTVADSDRVDAQSDLQGRIYVTNAPTDGAKPTYSATSAIAFTSATTATDIFTITGSASKTIRIIRVGFSAQLQASGVVDVLLVKRSSANTGGTSAAAAAVPNDSGSAAATATVLNYTVNPTLGATVGTVRGARVFFLTAGTDAGDSVYEWLLGNIPGQAMVLRGTTQVLAINLAGATINGATWVCYVEWTEE